MNLEVARMANMEQVVGFVFSPVASHQPVVDVDRSERATFGAGLAPSTGTACYFLTDLGGDGGHATPRMDLAT
jgi:hypothetical protein